MLLFVIKIQSSDNSNWARWKEYYFIIAMTSFLHVTLKWTLGQLNCFVTLRQHISRMKFFYKHIWTNIILKSHFLNAFFSLKSFCSCQSRSSWRRTKSSWNSCVVLSRTVQPENGDLKLNLRFVSPWNANSPQLFVRTNTKELQTSLDGVTKRSRIFCSSGKKRHFFFPCQHFCIDLIFLFTVKMFLTSKYTYPVVSYCSLIY